MTRTQTALLEAIRETPGITSTELVDKLQVADNLHILRGMLHSLEREGLITRDNARPKHCWPSDFANPEIIAIDQQRDLRDQITHLLEQASELREWQQYVMQQHPDLAASVKVMKLRQVVARYFPDRKDAIIAGQYDEKPIMQACLEAAELC